MTTWRFCGRNISGTEYVWREAATSSYDGVSPIRFCTRPIAEFWGQPAPESPPSFGERLTQFFFGPALAKGME